MFDFFLSCFLAKESARKEAAPARNVSGRINFGSLEIESALEDILKRGNAFIFVYGELLNSLFYKPFLSRNSNKKSIWNNI